MDAMVVFLLVVLLLAAMAGVLGAVLKATLVLVLSFVLAAVILVWLGSSYARRRFHRFRRDVEAQIDRQRRRDRAYDVASDPDRPGLPGDR